METIRERLGQFIRHKEGSLIGRPELGRILEYILRFAVAYALSRAEIFGMIRPFGLAIIAASGAGVPGLLATSGVIFGSILHLPFIWALRYAAIGILIFAANYVFCDMRLHKKPWFKPTIAMFMAIAVGFVYINDAGWGLTNLIFFLTEITLIGGSTYFFQIAMGGWGDAEYSSIRGLKRKISLLVLLCVCLIPLVSIGFWGGISLGRMLALFLLMCTAYRAGIGSGSAVGAALGLSMDAAMGGLPFFSMAYAFSGLFSGIFSRHGKVLFATSFILANAMAVLFTWEQSMQAASLNEVFLVSMAFTLIPSSFLSQWAIDLGEEVPDYAPMRVRSHTKEKVRRMSMAFASMYESMKVQDLLKGKNDNDVATVFDRAAEACCRTCVQSSDCWHVDYESTLNVLNDATGPMLARGELLTEDFPLHFQDNCKELERYVQAVNYELRALRLRRQFASRLEETRAAMYRQYADMGEILSDLATQIDEDMNLEPFRQRKLARYLKSKNVETESMVYRDRNGRIHVEIQGENLRPILREADHLEKLSANVGVPLRPKQRAVQGRNQLSFMEAEPFACNVGIASMRRRGQGVSGDRGSYFKTDEGFLYVILCDGMGSGPNAARESQEISQILEEFLQAGLDPLASMKLVNSALEIKHGELSTCASVDLLCINLFTGEGKLLKYGGAPSYIKQGDEVRLIRSNSFAAGLIKPEGPDVEEIKLLPGSLVLLVSDGVLADEGDQWLKKTIQDLKENDVKTVSRRLVQGAMDQQGVEDDTTALAVQFTTRALAAQ